MVPAMVMSYMNLHNAHVKWEGMMSLRLKKIDFSCILR